MSDFNPFASLIEGDPVPSGNSSSPSAPASPPHPQTVPIKPINVVLEDIFGFTLNEIRGIQRQLLFLEEIATSFSRNQLDLQVLQHALFDRLFMCNDDNSAIKEAKKQYTNSHAYEIKVVLYLYNCYRNLLEAVDNDLTKDEKNNVKALIVQNTVTAFMQSDIYQGQNLERQLIDVLKEANPYYDDFFKDICKGILSEDEGGQVILRNKLIKLLEVLTQEIDKYNIITFDYSIFNLLMLFCTEDYLANIYLAVRPVKFTSGSDYAITPLGALLNISIFPKSPNGIYEHFQDPTDQASNSAGEGVFWTNTEKFTEHIFTFVKGLIRCSPLIKNKTLEWIGNCMRANADRAKLWNSQAPPEMNPAFYTTVGDGFMINLGNVLLRLCQPFTATYFTDKKILKADPTYCGVPNDQRESKGIHLPNMDEQTCLVPRDSDDSADNNGRLCAEKYSFLTECFFFAHRAIQLGYQVTTGKLTKLNNEVGRMERVYMEAIAQSGRNSDIVDSLKLRMTSELSKYMSMKTELSNPVLIKMLFDLASATCYWLCQVAVHLEFEQSDNYAPLSEIPITFPLPEQIPHTLQCIPEFLIENLVSFLVFLKRFQPKVFEEQGYEKLKPILTFIVMYMGSSDRIKNPHVRASLAEALETLLPYHTDRSPQHSVGGYQRELLFTQHEHRQQIVPNLLNVFVGIEMTGQSVEFDYKFQYRRPMYQVLDYLWSIEEYRNPFKQLAEEAELNMDAVSPPLFLRFVNLLMNDAVYLLDEALSNMAKLKAMQQARENGDWDQLPPQERAQNTNYLDHIGVNARSHNILGRDTIKALEKLTSETTTVFTHATMVDRVAAMLNYFLNNLVGPNKKNFKVKDQKEFSFDPANTVLNICQIYVNLKSSDAFCLAVSQDGRSYSPRLFKLAEDVLIRIGGGILIGELEELAAKVEKISMEHQKIEEALAEAPEHFLDPIMSTLMSDPVILPSSKQTVDRTTIARHLLSDQTDPFNRAPLSMDQVIPNTELAEEIRKWVAERRRN